MQGRTERIEITTRLWHAMQLFRRSIANRHNDCRLALGLESPGDPKVNQFDLIVLGHHNIRWLEITKNNGRTLTMEIIQDAAYLFRPVAGTSLCYPTSAIETLHDALFLKHFAQGTSFDEIHH